MKTNSYTLIFAITLSTGLFTQCHKDTQEDPHNHSLLNKTIDQIRKEVAGKWQFKRGCGNGITGYTCNNNWPQNDFVNFLPNDTVKREVDANLIFYSKATVTKYKDNKYSDSVYLFDINFLYQWVMHEIKNDTLVMDEPGSQSVYFLVRP